MKVLGKYLSRETLNQAFNLGLHLCTLACEIICFGMMYENIFLKDAI